MSLRVDDLHMRFGGVHALRGVSLAVTPGECVALIGPNGAGKSTCFACIAGQHRPASGALWWCGERIDRLTPAQRQQRGMARTFQVAQVFGALTVLQNLQLVQQVRQGLRAWDRLDAVASAEPTALLQQMGLQAQAGVLAGALPYGARKRLELAIALCGLGLAGSDGQIRPQLLLLDEPAAGLAAQERAELMQLVQSLVAQRSGLAVLYTEHNMDAVFGVADRVLVLMDGALVAQGRPHEVAQDPVVRERYLGQGWEPVAATEVGDPLPGAGAGRA